MDRGLIFNIQRYCLDDGDGIRTVVFFKGCPLRCAWCHNPESWKAFPELLFDSRKCIGCGMCCTVCGNHCHTMQGEHIYSRADCKLCGNCAEVCPSCALELCGKFMTVEEVLLEVKRDLIYYKNGGGVTLSGGEPLMQPVFAVALAKKLTEEGIGVNIETSGYASGESIEAFAEYCDRFLYDIKAPEEDYLKYTGVEYDQISCNLKLLKKRNAQVTLRCPIVSGCNDTEAFAKHIAQAAEISGADSIHLLPYHSSGVYKCGLLGERAQSVFSAPDAAKLENFAANIGRRCNAKVVIK